MDARAGETMYLYEKVRCGFALGSVNLGRIDTIVSRAFRKHGVISII